jgi:hypothetical protein
MERMQAGIHKVFLAPLKGPQKFPDLVFMEPASELVGWASCEKKSKETNSGQKTTY